jgi:hypothetical protein
MRASHRDFLLALPPGRLSSKVGARRGGSFAIVIADFWVVNHQPFRMVMVAAALDPAGRTASTRSLTVWSSRSPVAAAVFAAHPGSPTNCHDAVAVCVAHGKVVGHSGGCAGVGLGPVGGGRTTPVALSSSSIRISRITATSGRWIVHHGAGKHGRVEHLRVRADLERDRLRRNTAALN